MTGEDIKRLRISQGLTQQQFADILDMDRGLISGMENGKKNVTKSTEVLINNYKKQHLLETKNLNSVEDPESSYNKNTIKNGLRVNITSMVVCKSLILNTLYLGCKSLRVHQITISHPLCLLAFLTLASHTLAFVKCKSVQECARVCTVCVNNAFTIYG